jgi:hypothetical protein
MRSEQGVIGIRIAVPKGREIQNDGNRELSYFNIDDLIKVIEGQKKRK